MRIAVFTDIHHNDQNLTSRHCVSAKPLLRQIFAKFADPETRPDMVVSLGDLIMAARDGTVLECRRNDAGHLEEILDCFAQTGFEPVHHIHGNHEDKNLTRFDVAEIASRYGMDFSSRAIQRDGVSLVLWSPGARIVPETNGAPPVSRAELNWLDATLSRVTHPAIVMTHLPLDGDLTNFKQSSLDGKPNPVFGMKTLKPGYYATHYPNAPQIRDLIARSGKVVACLAGHVHWTEARMDQNVAYITVPSLVENAEGKPHGGWAMVDHDSENREINIRIRGATPCTYRVSTDKTDKFLRSQRLIIS